MEIRRKNNPIPYRDDFDPDTPVVKAALTLAKRAHAGQMRGKADDSIPYIIHPIMVHDLLVHFGVTDDITRAVALLHDTKEDYKEFREDPKALQRELTKLLKGEGVTDAEEIAAYIDRFCQELTNDEIMLEGKRTWQVEHSGRLSNRAALIKILDQTSSELDTIMMPNDPKFSGKTEWSYKALNVVKAAADNRIDHKFFSNFHKAIFKYAVKLNLAQAEEAAQMRADFNFDDMVKRAEEMKDEPDVEISSHVRTDVPDEMDKGVFSVDLDKDGKVCFYSCLTNTEGDRNDAKNEVAEEMIARLEDSDLFRRVTVGYADVQGGRIMRVNKIKPPISVDEFNAIAKTCGAITADLSASIADAASKAWGADPPTELQGGVMAAPTQSDEIKK